MDDHGYAGDVAVGDLGGDGGDGIVDPGADFWVAVLVDGEVEGPGGEEGFLRVDVAVVEDVVDGDGEEGVEGFEEDVAFVYGCGCGGGLDGGWHFVMCESSIVDEFRIYAVSSKSSIIKRYSVMT